MNGRYKKVEAMAEAQTRGRIRALIKRLQVELAKKLEEDIKKHQESEYIEIDGMKIKKCLTQRIPMKKEEWEKYQRDKKAYGNKKRISFIEKVFFEDGALKADLPKEKKSCAISLKEMNKNSDLASYIDKVFFEDGALQLEKRGIRK